MGGWAHGPISQAMCCRPILIQIGLMPICSTGKGTTSHVIKVLVKMATTLGVGDDVDDGRIFPEHPSPTRLAPRDNISRKGHVSL